MTSLPDILAWVASHANRLRRPGYEPPNHLANGTVRFYTKDGLGFDLQLDSQGHAPEYKQAPVPVRIEIRDAQGAILYTEDEQAA
jgi:hypothetical protein